MFSLWSSPLSKYLYSQVCLNGVNVQKVVDVTIYMSFATHQMNLLKIPDLANLHEREKGIIPNLHALF